MIPQLQSPILPGLRFAKSIAKSFNLDRYSNASSYFVGVICNEAMARANARADREVSFSRRSNSDESFFFRSTMPRMYELTRGNKYIALHGYTAGVSDTPIQKVLEKLLSGYESRGEIDVASLDGSFTISLLDADSKQILLYRNLVGVAASYYTRTKDGFIFGSNLAEVARKSGMALSVNEEMLPVYFAYRTVPGANTLFDKIYRLQPGELLTYKDHQLTTRFIQTFAGFQEDHKTNEVESVERIESEMEAVLRDQMATHPDATGFLSGGVDSTYIQVHWNKLWRAARPGSKPKSAAIWLDHPKTMPDQKYCLTAAEEMDTDHHAVRMDGLTAHEMRTILAATGEMPNHLQSFYFATLGKKLADRRMSAGICGEGADGLFGSEAVSSLQKVIRLKEKYPLAMMRSLGAWLAQKTGYNYRARLLRTASICDDLTSTLHPINRNGAFTNWQTLEDCFGRGKVDSALAYRMAVIRQAEIPVDSGRLTWCTLGIYINGAVGTASLWNQMMNLGGTDMLCPFLDSRIIRVAMNIENSVRYVQGNPKQVLKKALRRHVNDRFINRPKRGFGQPIMEWMSEGGPLRGAINSIAVDQYDFLTPKTFSKMKSKPDWFLYNLLIYDLWRKSFNLR
jgi:asparagine synthase (glutamine-hydrolysing)